MSPIPRPGPDDPGQYAFGDTARVERILKEAGFATPRLQPIDRPVFLALGRYDFLVAPPSAWDAIRPQFRDLTVRVFERSGHTPQYEEATLFDAELMRWMKKRRLAYEVVRREP